MVLPDFHSVVVVLQTSLQLVEEHELPTSIVPDKGNSIVDRFHDLQQSSMLVPDEVFLIPNQQMVKFIPQASALQDLVHLGLG